MLVALVRHLIDDGDAEAELAAQLRHGGGAALAALAEVEVIARDHMGDAQPLHQVADDEVFRAEFGQRPVEGQHRHEGGAQRRDQPRLQRLRRQAEHRLVRLEIAARVRLEADDAPGPSEPPGFGRGSQQRLVAAVHAVEIADGDDGAPAVFRNGREARDHMHSNPFSRPCEVMDGRHDAGMGHGGQHRASTAWSPSLASVTPSATRSASRP